MIIDQDIYLRPLKYTDAQTIFEGINSSRAHLRVWLPFVDKTQSVADSEAFIKSVLDHPPEQRELVWTIWFQDHFAGLIGTNSLDHENQKTEIGYWLVQKHEGKGIMIRCVRRVMEHLFHHEHLNRIALKVAPENHRSRNIPLRLGFSYEGLERQGEKLINNRFVDIEIYSMLRREFYEHLSQ
jgi:ribosomal-protein-serine acetyltransferase